MGTMTLFCGALVLGRVAVEEGIHFTPSVSAGALFGAALGILFGKPTIGAFIGFWLAVVAVPLLALAFLSPMRRPQFSLRALLVLMLSVACFFGGVRFERERRRRSDEAARAEILSRARPQSMNSIPWEIYEDLVRRSR